MDPALSTAAPPRGSPMRARSILAARRCLGALVVGLAIAAGAAAQTGLPGLLRDIAEAPAPVIDPRFGNGLVFVRLGSELYFAGWDQTAGLELRATDGTAAGTRTVRDVCPGSCSGFWYRELVASDGVLYFIGDDGEHGRELWRSDGTRAGTRMVMEIVPGGDHVEPSYLTPAPGGVYFVANDGTHGFELWRSDGTAAGTHLVADVWPGAGSDLGPSHLTWLPGMGLVFMANDGVHGREPWLTQGTAATTTLLADVRSGPADSVEYATTYVGGFDAPGVAGGKVFFAADDGTHGREPWMTDGTPAGTALVSDVNTGSEGSEPNRFFPFAGGVLFDAGTAGWSERTLWRSDGSASGTVPLGDAAHGSDLLDPRDFAELGGVVYFAGYQAATGYELWRTDGTLAGTQLAVDVFSGASSGVYAYGSLVAAEGRLWFPATDGPHGVEWWQSDGTAPGTFEVADLLPGPDSSFWPYNAEKPAGVGGRVLFVGFDGARFWTVRAALPGVAGSTVVQGAGERPGSVLPCVLGICPMVMTPSGDGVAFVAYDGAAHGGEPWRSDGTESGTLMVADVAPGAPFSMFPTASNRNIAAFGDDLLLIAADCAPEGCADADFQLRRADPAGNLEQLSDEAWSVAPGELAVWNDIGFFAAENGVWKSDGSVSGTGLLSAAALSAHWFAPAAARLYFAAGWLWRTDGTAGGTAPLATALDYGVATRPVPASDGAGKERVYFVAGDATAGRELWTSDGSDAGTGRVVDLRAGPVSSIHVPDNPGFEEPSLLATVGLGAFFVADDGVAGEELWVSDGSPGNAALLEVRAGAAGSAPRDLTTVGNRVYFVADDGVHGREPWVSDGTMAGTHLVADVRPGPESSAPKDLADWMGRLVFAADDDVHGMELWRVDADGNTAQLVTDLRPGVEPSSPQGLTAVGERLYFFADDGATGLEPWIWSAAAALFADGFETGSVARWSRVSPF